MLRTSRGRQLNLLLSLGKSQQLIRRQLLITTRTGDAFSIVLRFFIFLGNGVTTGVALVVAALRPLQDGQVVR